MTGFIVETLLGLQIGLVCRNPRSQPVTLTIPVQAGRRPSHVLVYSSDGALIDKRPLVRRGSITFATATLPPAAVLVVEA